MNTANFFKQYPGPVLLRWNHEFNKNEQGTNQNCQGFGTSLTSDEIQNAFIGAWQNIWTIFQQAGATNVIFSWNPGDYTPGGTDDPSGYYPSKAPYTVDSIELDTFQKDGEPFSADFGQFYADYTGINPGNGQPYAKPLGVGAHGSPYSDGTTQSSSIRTSMACSRTCKITNTPC